MTDGINLSILVSFSEVFEEPPQSLSIYLTGISRSKLLNASAFFLGFSNHDSEFDDYKQFLSMFFRQENSQIANEIFLKLNRLQEKAQSELVIVNPLTILQLFEFCFENLTDEESQTETEVEINIFKAILLLNEQNISKQNIALTSSKVAPENLKLAALSFSQTFPYSELINYDSSEVLNGQMIKSVFLFEFLQSNPKTNVLLISFLKHFDCPDWQYFLKSIFPLSFAVVQTKQEAHVDIVIEKGEKFDITCEFLEKLSVTDTEELDDYDFSKIRSKPFYKVSDGVYRIINGLFVMEMIHKGIFFKLAEINNNLPEENKIKNFRSFYCDEFSEKYLLYKLLNSIYKNRYIEYSGEKIKELGVTAEPDYYIRNGNHLFLFESKDILINSSIKSSYDYSLYEPEFKKKLYFEIKDDKIQKKAVLQLINNIEAILTRKLEFDTNYKATSIHIYPLLILHDRQFNVAGLNLIVNSWFQEELQKLKGKGIFIDKVKPITIIDIDTLLFHQDIFRNRILKLNQILDDYFKFITFDQNRKYNNEDHVRKYAKRTVVSFSLFLSNYTSDRKIWKAPKMILDKGASLFD